MIPAGQARMLPDEVAELLVGAHPEKLYFADEGDRDEAAPDPPVPAEGQRPSFPFAGRMSRRGRWRRKRPGRTEAPLGGRGRRSYLNTPQGESREALPSGKGSGGCAHR